jgi:hypothetical protein
MVFLPTSALRPLGREKGKNSPVSWPQSSSKLVATLLGLHRMSCLQTPLVDDMNRPQLPATTIRARSGRAARRAVESP